MANNAGNNENTKNLPKNAADKSASKEKGGFIAYLKGVRQELKKVVWPTKEELGTSTVVVIVTCALFAVAFWAIDTGFLAALKSILGITLS